MAVVVALPAALNGALAVAEHQVRDSNGPTRARCSCSCCSSQVVSLLATFLATAAAYRLVADAYLGRPVDPAASLRFGLRRVGSVIWVSVLAGLGIFVGLLLLVVPGVYLAVAWSVAIPVLLGENLRGRGGAPALARPRARALVALRGRASSCRSCWRRSCLRDRARRRPRSRLEQQRHRALPRSRRLESDRGHARAAVPGGRHDGALHRPPRAQGRLRRPAAHALARARRRGRT